MTDTQKALQIAEKHKVEYRVLLGNRPAIVPSDSECYGSAIEMAKWKDQQLKEYLEKTRKQYTECNNVPAWITLDKIIKELFNED